MVNNLYFRSRIEQNKMIETKQKSYQYLLGIGFSIILLFGTNSLLSAQELQLQDTTRVCFADSVFLDAGEGFQNYLWNNGERSQIILARDTGWYYVSAVRENMEVPEDSTWVFFQNAKIDMVDTILTCYTYPVTLCVEPNTLMYSWTSDDPGLFIEYDTAACVDVIPRLDTTTVYVSISDSLGIITCVDSVKIWLYPRMYFDEVNQINTGCPGTCKGQLQVLVSGGLPPYTFKWPTATPVQYDSIVFGLCEQEYLIEVTDQYLCERDTMLPVEVFDMPEVQIIRDPEDKIYIENPVVNFSFENLSIDSLEVIDWNWDFGDSTYSKKEMPIKSKDEKEGAYDQARTYDVWLKYTTGDECIDSVTMQVVISKAELKIPNVFTPNGDGANELFVITDLEKYISNELKIFSRYGKRVYSQKNYQSDWGGGGLSQGVYFYVLTIESYFGTEVKQGSLTIFR